jgi:hypothetical protein
MLSRKRLRRAELTEKIVQDLPGVKSPEIRVVMFQRVLSATLLICAAGPSTLLAQIPFPPEPHECAVILAKPLKAPDDPDTIENLTKVELAAEWIDVDSDGVGHVLGALQLLTSSSVAADLNQRILEELRSGGNDSPSRQGVYQAVIGDGQGGVQGFAKLVDLVANSNNLHLKAPEDEHGLFDCTKKLVNIIFENKSTPTPLLGKPRKNGAKPDEIAGPVALARIYSSFNGKANYAALYQLLDAFPKPKDNGTQVDKDNYAKGLEKLRAAFEMNTDSLASQVAAKIPVSKQ